MKHAERARANTPGLTRRSLLSALPASGLAAALPQVAPAAAPDPVVLIYQEWLAARRECRRMAYMEGNENLDLPEYIEAEKRENRAETDLLETAPTSIEGIGALAAFAWSEVCPQTMIREEFEWRANAFECQAVLAIWRACTGGEGYPDV